MATKKSSKSTARSTPQPKSKLQNLAARPTNFDETIDDQLVDHSGVFRVTSALAQAQTGHEEGPASRFASDSLVIEAQRDGFQDEGPTLDEAIEDHVIEDEGVKAARRERLATLAARHQARTRSRR